MRTPLLAVAAGIMLAIPARDAPAEQILRTVPRASCGPNERPEGMQGRTALAQSSSKATAQAYNCNLELVGQFVGEPPGHGMASFDRCVYYSTFPTPQMTHPGVSVLDIADSRRPQLTAYLNSPAMLDADHALMIDSGRKLLLGAKLLGADLDLYDLSADCRHPRLIGSSRLPGTYVHAGHFTTDSRTFYGASYGTRGAKNMPPDLVPAVYAIDTSNPLQLRNIATWTAPSENWRTHTVSLNKDGTRAYLSLIGDGALDPTGLVILDVSDIQARRSGANMRIVSTLFWHETYYALFARPVTIAGRPYVIIADIAGALGMSTQRPTNACASGKPAFGFVRIVDVSDEKQPRIASKLMLEVHDPVNCSKLIADPIDGLGYGSFDYDVDDEEDAKMLAVGHLAGGLRVFDIRDPYRPREMAYYVPPARTLARAAGRTGPPVPRADEVMFPKFLARAEEIGFTSVRNGFQVVRFSDRFRRLNSGLFDEQSASAGSAGDAAYQTYCASCHGPTFAGGFGPSLVGAPFRDKWAAAPSGALLTYIRTKMPPAMPDSLTPETYAAIHDSVAGANDLPFAQLVPPASGVTDEPSPTPVPEHQLAEVLATNTALDPFAQSSANSRRALLAQLSPVTDAVLRRPPDGDWLLWRRTLDNLGHSPLKQIDRTNVTQLRLAWSLSLPPGTNGIAPLVHDGVMFVNVSGKVMALGAATGELLWTYAGSAGLTTRTPLSQPRTIALYGDRVYVPTLDGKILALDMRSGKLLRDHSLFAPEDPLVLTTGPLVIRNKIIQGVSGCSYLDYPGGCYISALDADTGREIWRFHSIARPNQPGGDSWNGAEVKDRFGGSIWTTASYDPDLNLAYIGTGQTYKITTLLQPNARRGSSNDALFTDSTLALDPDTGKLRWHYQHFAGDVWDLDWASERALMTLQDARGPRRVVLTGGKIAIFDALDAKTGQYLFSVDAGMQNLVQSIDPLTGRKQVNPLAKFSADSASTVCPYHGSGKNWPAASYDPVNLLLFVPIMDDCMNIKLAPDSPGGGIHSVRNGRSADGDGRLGRVAALDLRTRSVAWTNRRRAPQMSAVLATAGGLVFEGSSDRTFRALDAQSGATLWETPLNEMPNGFPITFLAGGAQYVAIIAGGGTVIDAVHRSLTPEIESSSGARTIWVFKLGAFQE